MTERLYRLLVEHWDGTFNVEEITGLELSEYVPTHGDRVTVCRSSVPLPTMRATKVPA